MNDILDRALDTSARVYNIRPDDLDDLAAEFVASVEAGHEAGALRYLVEESLGMLIARCCLLDECDDNSYAVEHQAAGILTEAIIAQGRTATALRELTAERIEHRAGLLGIISATAALDTVPDWDEAEHVQRKNWTWHTLARHLDDQHRDHGGFRSTSASTVAELVEAHRGMHEPVSAPQHP